MVAVLQAVVPDDEKEQVLNASYTRVEFMNWTAEIPARPTTTTPLGQGSQSEPAEWTDAERASIREATLEDAEEELFMNQYPEASLERYKECANKRELTPRRLSSTESGTSATSIVSTMVWNMCFRWLNLCLGRVVRANNKSRTVCRRITFPGIEIRVLEE